MGQILLISDLRILGESLLVIGLPAFDYRQSTLRPSDSLEGHIDRNKNKIQKHARKHFLLQHILRAIEYYAEEIYYEVVAFPEYIGSKNGLHEAFGTLRPQAREDKRRSIAPNKSA